MQDIYSLLSLSPGSSLGIVPGSPGEQMPIYGDETNGYKVRLPPYGIDTTTQIGQDPWAQMLARYPGIGGAGAQSVANINQNLQGQFSDAAMRNLQQDAAARAMGIGSPGSANANAALYANILNQTTALQNLGGQQLNALFQAYPIQNVQAGAQTTDYGPAQSVYNAMPNPALTNAANANALMAGLRAGASGGGMGGIQSMIPQSTRDMSWAWTPYSPKATSMVPGAGASTSGQFSQGDWIWDASTGLWWNQVTGLPDFGDSDNWDTSSAEYPTSSYEDYWNTPIDEAALEYYGYSDPFVDFWGE